jgi:hypothetical protein
MHRIRNKLEVLPEPLKDGRPMATAESEARDGQLFILDQIWQGSRNPAERVETRWRGIRRNKEWVELELYCTIR